MKKKNFLDIYTRNVKGTFWGGFSEVFLKIYPVGALVPIIHAALLPLTLTFGAAIKSLIDFFSRKEIAEETLNAVNDKIDALDEKSIEPLIREISTYKNAKSASSQKLMSTLNQIPHETHSVIQKAMKDKKRALQEEQLGIDKNPELLDMYQDNFIAKLQLNEVHQKKLEDYIQENDQHCKEQQLKNQKAAVKAYLGADHNYGKRMQQVICNHFFPPAAVSVAPQPTNEIRALPTFTTN